MELAELPTKRGFFTAENAAFYAKKSHAPDSARNRPEPEPVNIVAIPATAQQPAIDELSIVEEQIKRAREELNDETPFCTKCERPALQPHHRAQLMKALDGFLERRYVLLNGGKPGIAKGNTKPKSRTTYPEPVPQFQIMHEAPAEPQQAVSGDWQSLLF